MNDKLVSVLIPTRNRQEYALKTVKQILEIDDNRLEIIVQDNSDDDTLSAAIAKVNDSRVKYNYVKERLSGVDNFDLASQLATGKYVCAIGDDDGILDNILECAEWMQSKKIDMVKVAVCAVYHWPIETSNKVLKKRQSKLKIYSFSGKYRVLDTQKGVIELLKNGGQNYRKYDVVSSYHGLISMKCMQAVRAKTGVCYGGLSPDIYNAVCLSLLKGTKCVEIDYPITISGICGVSTSAMSAEGKHVGRLTEAPHFIGTHNYVWDKRVVSFYSVETIWAESMMKAVNNMNTELDLDELLDTERILELAIKNNYKHRQLIYENLPFRVDAWHRFKYFTKYLNKQLRKFATRINVWQRELRKIDLLFESVMNIEQAYHICKYELQKENNRCKWDYIKQFKE